MLDAPERVGARFSILLFLGFLLAPLAGFGTALLFGVMEPWQIQPLLAGLSKPQNGQDDIYWVDASFINGLRPH